MIKQMGGLCFLIASLSLFSKPVLANEALAKNKACLACHQVDRKIVGPAFKDIASKYKGNKNAAAQLAAKIQSGGKGVWGPLPMPPQNVTEDEAKKLATWVLSL
jgi:cytochrome c